MPFAMPWSDAAPDVIRQRLLQWHWNARASWAPDSWNLLLVAFVDGAPVGAQDIAANDFGDTRSIGSGSWLRGSLHGQGIGTEMREALLQLAFEGLEAVEATSGAYHDNAASIRVSEKCGYVQVGERDVIRRRGELAPGGASSETVPELRFRIDRVSWLARRRADIEVAGIDAEVRCMLGMSVAD
jgi:RimJ/RimL family protein N-acetyltransferase